MKKERAVFRLPVMLFVIALLGGFALLVYAAQQMPGYGMSPGMMRGYGMSWMTVWMVILMLVIWALIIAAIVLVALGIARAIGGGITPSATPRESPTDILKARYAKGEITQEQFGDMRKALGV